MYLLDNPFYISEFGILPFFIIIIIIVVVITIIIIMGRDSAVCIATRYGLDGPVFESPWGGDFPHLSRLALGPTMPPIQWIAGVSRG